MKNYIKLYFVVLITLLCSVVNAHDFEVDGIYYTITSKTEMTVGVTYKGSSYNEYSGEYAGNVAIPRTVVYDGVRYSVTSIGTYAFAYCSSLTSITIPNSVTSIGYAAFEHCRSLTSISIPNSVTSIGEYAFVSCSSLTSISIPNSVTSIGYDAFGYCSSLTSITIPDGVTSIEGSAFRNCSSLTSITIPNSVTSIGDYAFYECTDLTSITIPNSVTSIGSYAFRNCKKLYTVINLSNFDFVIGSTSNGYITYNAKVIVNKSDSLVNDFYFRTTADNRHFLITYVGNDSILELPKDYKGANYRINTCAFYSNSKLQKVVIPDGVMGIGRSAFYNCGNLENIAISNSLDAIGDSAFQKCARLRSIVVPNKVPEIREKVFDGCVKLRSVTIGASVTEIAPTAFIKCNLLGKAIWMCNTPPNGYGYVNAEINYVSNDQYQNIGNMVKYPHLSSLFDVNGVKYVPVSPVERTCDVIDCVYDSITDVVCIDSVVLFKGVAMKVKDIMPLSFYYNANLKTVTTNNAGFVGDKAFYHCSNLNSTTISDKVKRIDNYAFKGCGCLKTLVIEDRNNELGLCSNGDKPLFSDCPLDSVYIGGKLDYDTTANCGYSPFYNNLSLRSLVISNNEDSIYDKEFYACSNLKSVLIGDGAVSIGKQAFNGCTSLDSVALGKSMSCIGAGAFNDCYNIKKFISKAKIPPFCESQALDDINKWECTLYVPSDAMGLYQQEEQWRDFFFINGIQTSVDEVRLNEKVRILGNTISFIDIDNKSVVIYSVDGTLVKRIDGYSGEEIVLDEGVYIIRVGGKSMKVKL